MKTVLIVQGQMKQYRVPFFEKLHEVLAQDGIGLRVAYSAPPPSEVKKGDNRDLPAEYGMKVKAFRIRGEKVLYQPLFREALAADLVIVEQANKYVLNYPLLLLSSLGIKKVAFWGHGRNRQSREQGFSAWLKNNAKKTLLNRVDWWFAYTEGTSRYLIENDVPASRITSVQNAIDTKNFHQQCVEISTEEIAATRKQLGIGDAAKVGLFCGGIYREKLPEFLIDSARQIRQRIPSFELLIVGDGPERKTIESAARGASWIHCLGPKFGHEKALCFRMADVFLMPGLVGLAILDAFTAGLPVITTSFPFHSPEIEYLEEGRNGMVTAQQTLAYAQAVAALLQNEAQLRALRAGAASSGEVYTIENMVERFRQGIRSCLNMSKEDHTSNARTVPARPGIV